MKQWFAVCVCAFGLMGFLGCAKKDSGSGGGGSKKQAADAELPTSTDTTSSVVGFKDGHGCIQGVVINGYTGQPVDLEGKTESLYVLIRDLKLHASAVADDNLKGQFYICGIPLDNEYPVLGFFKGMHPFESAATVFSTAAVQSNVNGAYTNVVKKDPVLTANIVVFPKATAKRDLVIHVTHEGSPVEGVRVDIEPVAASINNFTQTVTGSALNYTNGTRNYSQTVTTDAKGNATFKADSVSLGQPYSLNVTPATSEDLNPAVGSFTLGISGTALSADTNHFEYNVELGGSDQALALLTCSVDNSSYDNAGQIVAEFNRDVELIGPDGWLTTLGGANQATIATNVPSNNASEQVDAQLVGGRVLILKPKWGSQPLTPDYNDDASQSPDLEATVTFQGIKVNVVGDDTINVLTLTDGGLLSAGGCDATRIFREHPGP